MEMIYMILKVQKDVYDFTNFKEKALFSFLKIHSKIHTVTSFTTAA